MTRRSIYAWASLILGILMIVLGVFTVMHPGKMLTAVVVIYGISALVSGISDMVSVGKWGTATGFVPFASLITGMLGVLAGVMLIAFPNAGKFVLGLLLPIWFIAHCLSRLATVYSARFLIGTGWTVLFTIIDVLGVVLGVVMIFSPKLSQSAVGLIIAFYLFLVGIEHIAEAFTNLGAR